jgi:hypothetical protein
MKQLYAQIIEDLDLADRNWNRQLEDLLRGDLDWDDLLGEEIELPQPIPRRRRKAPATVR